MIFSTIKIKDAEIYLKTEVETGELKWTKNKSDCIVFSSDQQAEQFAEKYFINFENWEVVDVEIQYH